MSNELYNCPYCKHPMVKQMVKSNTNFGPFVFIPYETKLICLNCGYEPANDNINDVMEECNRKRRTICKILKGGYGTRSKSYMDATLGEDTEYKKIFDHMILNKMIDEIILYDGTICYALHQDEEPEDISSHLNVVLSVTAESDAGSYKASESFQTKICNMSEFNKMWDQIVNYANNVLNGNDQKS